MQSKGIHVDVSVLRMPMGIGLVLKSCAQKYDKALIFQKNCLKRGFLEMLVNQNQETNSC